MAKARKTYRPLDPAEAHRIMKERDRNPEQWGLNTTALSLVANSDIATEEATRKTVARAKRYDTFELLHTRKALSKHALDAVRRLEDDMAIRARAEGPRLEVIGADASSAGSAEGVTTRSMVAGRNVDRVLGLSTLAEDAGLGIQREMWRKVLLRLSGLPVSNWRAAVKDLTGDHRKPHQVNYVVRAAEALALAFVEIDAQAPRKAVA